MADAEVIPIGGRGKPGRGSATSPSEAARALSARPRARATKKTDAASTGAGSSGATPTAKKPTARKPATKKATAAKAAASSGKRATGSARKTSAAKRTAPVKAAGSSGALPGSSSRPKPVRKKSSKAEARQAPSAESAVDPPRRRTKDLGASPLADVTELSTPVDADEVGEVISEAARDLFGDVSWEQRLAELLAFLRRRITGDYDVDEFGFDQEITDRFLLTALRPLAEKWFRIDVHGVENIPAEGGALVVSNHSGTVPVDGLMTSLVLHDHTGRYLRMLGADLVFTLPFIGELARKGGATLASNEDAERMLSKGDLVGVWPEGFKGIGKPFSERYKLQRFGRGGFVSAALRTGVPIVPCSVVGAEEIYPLVGNIPSLARLLGVPYIPITPLFPWLGALGMVPLPSKWLIEFGEPIRTDSYGEGAADDPMLVFNVTDQVRETIQQTLYALLIRRRSVFS